MAGKRSGGPWYGNFRDRLLFEGETFQVFKDIQVVQEHNRKLAGRVYRLTVEVPEYGNRRIEIRFAGTRHPVIFSDGPTDSPHRFRDDSLCIWWGRDDPQRKWVFADGLLELIGLTIIHLFKEAWWRETGEWLGEEAPHGTGPKDREEERS